MAIKNKKAAGRIRRKRSIRKRISGTSQRPRVSVFRSGQHIYAQVVDDASGATLASASTLNPEIRGEREGKKKAEMASLVGKLLAERCLAKSIEQVVFDRNGYIYHGRVKAVAEGARQGGLKF